MPPISCTAFGDEFEVEATSGQSCVPCTLPRPWPVVIMGSMVVLFVLFAIAYATVMVLRPAYLKHLFSTIGIFIGHLQTITILTNLRLAWPQSTVAVKSFLVVNGLQLDAARPECVAKQLWGGGAELKVADAGHQAFLASPPLSNHPFCTPTNMHDSRNQPTPLCYLTTHSRQH